MTIVTIVSWPPHLVLAKLAAWEVDIPLVLAVFAAPNSSAGGDP